MDDVLSFWNVWQIKARVYKDMTKINNMLESWPVNIFFDFFFLKFFLDRMNLNSWQTWNIWYIYRRVFTFKYRPLAGIRLPSPLPDGGSEQASVDNPES